MFPGCFVPLIVTTTIMPPRTRSNRVEKLAYQHMVTLGKPVNAFGLPSLPDELFLLIISFFQTCQIPEETRDLPGNGVAPRHKILLVLTMTCRALRRVCLPFLWQRVEARAGMEGVDDVISGHGGQHWMKTGHLFLYDKALSREVLRQLETVTIREPKYAVYVKYVVHLLKVDLVDLLNAYSVVNLDIMQSTDTLLQELLNSLELFPRLHTVRLRTGGRLFGKELQRIQALLSSWQPKAPLASVKKWYSNQLVSRLMRFCPNVHSAGGLLFDTLELGQLQMTLVHTMEAIERLENVTTAFFVKMPGTYSDSDHLRWILIE